MKRGNFVESMQGYATIQEAAGMMRVSERTVYGYIEDGSLAAFRFGRGTVVKREDVRTYRRKAPGRARINTPDWHTPPVNNPALLTTITVRILPEQNEQLDQKLNEIRREGRHILNGTARRSIARRQNEVQIMLIWRATAMPPEEERAAALAAFRAELADVLDWEMACVKESQVLLLT